MNYNAVGLPWRSKIGTDVSNCANVEEVLEKAGLDFYVEKCELVARMPFSLNGNNDLGLNDFAHEGNIYRDCPNGYATYRTDVNVPLGVVKSKYEVVQNIDAFNFINTVVGEAGAQFETAGCFGYGHKVFITAKLPVQTTVGGDPIDNYLIFSTSHDGTGSVDILFSPIRVFCLNMLNAAKDEASAHIRLRHTKSVRERLEFGAEVLKVGIQYAQTSQILYEGLLGIKMTDDQVRDYIARLQLTPAQYQGIIDYDNKNGLRKVFDRDFLTLRQVDISTQKTNVMNNMFSYYKNGVAQEDIVGTAWGAYNAITGYYSNVKAQEDEKRMSNLVFGADRNAMSKALNLVTEYALVA